MIDVPESTASEEPKRGRSKRRGEEYGAPSLLPLPPYFSPSAHFAWVSTQPGAAAASAPLRAAPESSKHSECRRPGPPPLAGPGSGASMEHLGPHHLHPGHAEPISFGIDQILNSPDQGGCMGPASRLQDGEYGLGCLVGGAYPYGGGGPAAGAGAGGAGAYGAGGPSGPGGPAGSSGGGGACSMGPLAGSYNMNMALAGGPGPGGGGGSGSGGGGGALSASGVIRVPAHRPLAGAVAHPQPLATGLPTVPSVPAVPGVNNLTGLTFPWMESNRRYTKDRFTGESGRRASRLAAAWALLYPRSARLPAAPSARQVTQLLSALSPSSAAHHVCKLADSTCWKTSPSLGPFPSLPQDPFSEKLSYIPPRSPWARSGGGKGYIASGLPSAGIWGSGISEKRARCELFLPSRQTFFGRGGEPQKQTQRKTGSPSPVPLTYTPPKHTHKHTHTLRAPRSSARRAAGPGRGLELE